MPCWPAGHAETAPSSCGPSGRGLAGEMYGIHAFHTGNTWEIFGEFMGSMGKIWEFMNIIGNGTQMEHLLESRTNPARLGTDGKFVCKWGPMHYKTGNFTDMGLTKYRWFWVEQSLDAKVSHGGDQSTWICPSWQSEMLSQARREAQAQWSTYDKPTCILQWLGWLRGFPNLIKCQLQNVCLVF